MNYNFIITSFSFLFSSSFLLHFLCCFSNPWCLFSLIVDIYVYIYEYAYKYSYIYIHTCKTGSVCVISRIYMFSGMIIWYLVTSWCALPWRRLLLPHNKQRSLQEITTNQNAEFWSPVLRETFTIQLPYIQIRDHCSRGGWKIMSQKVMNFTVILCFLMSKATPIKSH